MTARSADTGRSGRRAVIAGTALITASVAVLVACVVRYLQQGAAVTGIISDEQYRQVRIGTARADVLHELGSPAQGLDVSRFPARGPGADCVYYSESGALMDPAVFQFCFTGTRLSTKQSSDSLTSSATPAILTGPSEGTASQIHHARQR